MADKVRYTIKKYMLLIVAAVSFGDLLSLLFFSWLGFNSQALVIFSFFSLPLMLFIALYGFYKGLVKYYGLQGDEKLFFGRRL